LSEDFIKIADCKTALKGSFKGVIIKQGDLKSGTTKDGKDWTKKVFTIGDDSGEADLVAWGDEIKLFSVGSTYEIVNPWWKTYDGKISVQVGNYGTATLIGTDKSIPDTPPMPKEQSTLTTEETKKPAGDKNLDRITDEQVKLETLLLSKIHNTVTKTLGEEKKDTDSIILTFTELIYKKYFGVL